MAVGDDPVVGKLASVTHPIAPDRPGEVVIHIRGGTEVYMAVSDTDLAKGAEVLVVGQQSARTVEVIPFVGGPDPIHFRR
jgi:membrane protein implicated in regulation of membrane protease activity